MSFKKAVATTQHLEDAWRPGLAALRAKDRQHVDPEAPRQLQGSVNLDGSLQETEPDAHRWDYAIGYRHANRQEDCVYWVEIHTANDKEVAVVLEKFHWLKQWLTADGTRLNQFERDFIWVSSGATRFTHTAPKVKQLAQLGLQHTGRPLRIPSVRSS